MPGTCVIKEDVQTGNASHVLVGHLCGFEVTMVPYWYRDTVSIKFYQQCTPKKQVAVGDFEALDLHLDIKRLRCQAGRQRWTAKEFRNMIYIRWMVSVWEHVTGMNATETKKEAKGKRRLTLSSNTAGDSRILVLPCNSDRGQLMRQWDPDRIPQETLEAVVNGKPPAAAPEPQPVEECIPTLEEAQEIKSAWIERGARKDDEQMDLVLVADGVTLDYLRYRAAAARAKEGAAGGDVEMGEGQ